MELEERMRPPLSPDFNRKRRFQSRNSYDSSGWKSKHSSQLRPYPTMLNYSSTYRDYIYLQRFKIGYCIYQRNERQG